MGGSRKKIEIMTQSERIEYYRARLERGLRLFEKGRRPPDDARSNWVMTCLHCTATLAKSQAHHNPDAYNQWKQIGLSGLAGNCVSECPDCNKLWHEFLFRRRQAKSRKRGKAGWYETLPDKADGHFESPEEWRNLAHPPTGKGRWAKPEFVKTVYKTARTADGRRITPKGYR